MNLRATTLLIVLLTFLGLILVLTTTMQTVLVSRFEEMEQQNVHLNLQRAVRIVNSEFDFLERMGRDWARSDRAYQFVQDGNEAYIEENLSEDTLSSLDINLIAFLDSTGDVVYGTTYHSGMEMFLPLPEEFSAHFVPDDLLLQPSGEGDSLSGIFSLGDDPLLIVCQPILPSGGDGPARGTFIVGRFLDSAELLRLGSLIQTLLDLVPYDDLDLPNDLSAASDTLLKEERFVLPVSEDQVSGYALLRDIYGEPAYVLRVDQSRLFYQNGRRMLSLLNVAVISAGAVFGIITIMFLEMLVFSRLTRLSKEVNAIRISDDISKRVKITRNDELSRLSQNINEMLAALELAQEKLRQRVDELVALNDSSLAFLSQFDIPTTLENICTLAVENFGVDVAWIGVPSRDHTRIDPAASYGCALEAVPAVLLTEENPAAEVIKTGLIVVSDHKVPCAAGRECFQASFPLSYGPENLSALTLLSFEENIFFQDRMRTLEAFSNLTNMALQNANLFMLVRNGRKRLETLSRRLVEFQEEERRRIALELHDEIGQILTGLNLLLMGISTTLPEQQQRLDDARGLTNDLIRRVRQMSLTLRPAMLDDLGLLPTLLWHFENYTRQGNIRVNFQHTDIEGQRYPPEIETVAYRVIQEALTNVARHAGVDEVIVQVWCSEGVMNIQVEDEGAGFDPEGTAQSGKTLGVMGMQERANSLRGKLTIDSQLGRGTSLIVQIPLDRKLERRRRDRLDLAG
ncbi:MAG: histidine kinase [Anaerolineaceae bacterium]|nr:histidine kinase [Anaerolineaceae bacterium]